MNSRRLLPLLLSRGLPGLLLRRRCLLLLPILLRRWRLWLLRRLLRLLLLKLRLLLLNMRLLLLRRLRLCLLLLRRRRLARMGGDALLTEWAGLDWLRRLLVHWCRRLAYHGLPVILHGRLLLEVWIGVGRCRGVRWGAGSGRNRVVRLRRAEVEGRIRIRRCWCDSRDRLRNTRLYLPSLGLLRR